MRLAIVLALVAGCGVNHEGLTDAEWNISIPLDATGTDARPDARPDAGTDLHGACNPVTSTGCPDDMKCGVPCYNTAVCMTRGTGAEDSPCLADDDTHCDRRLSCVLNTCRYYCRTDADCTGKHKRCKNLGAAVCDRSAFSVCD